MPKHLDHIVILVADLAHASADYAALGLTVTPGGEHTSGTTHNALVSFEDGTYFELIAFKEPGKAPGHRWDARRAQGEGLIDFALLSEDLTAESVVTQPSAVSPRGPIEMGRLRPDGARVDWRIIALSATQSALPFVIEDVTPRRLRVPDGAAMRHRLAP
ncbi:MAG: VOC family protein, partial [Chloroflexota bacterium]|nr:VOC family protein [Chloroflexota bacterium]